MDTIKMDAEIPKSLGKVVEGGFENASVVNPEGSQFKLGKNAFWVWKSCHRNKTRERFVQDYATEFNIDITEAELTSEEILSNLKHLGLVGI